jgi:exosome complex exonuclease DIS3/RRP44/DIS3-like exonuclease 1
MLPALLSENLASLLHGQDRLAVSCVWTLGPDLSVRHVWFGRTVIRSRHQLHYYQAQAIYDRAPPPSLSDALDAGETAAVRADLDVVVGFATTMHAIRTRGGAVELASAELRFETTSDGQPMEVLTKGEVPMMRVVAELMIAANSATATRIHRQLPSSAFVRRHAPPKADGFDELRALVAAEGVTLDASTGAALARSLAAAAAAAADPAASTLFRGLATRAMSEAQYVSTGAAPPADGGGFGHYGLALDMYTHFTSPIRRYADVIAHRQLLAALCLDAEGGGEGDVDAKMAEAEAGGSGGQSSQRDVAAAAGATETSGDDVGNSAAAAAVSAAGHLSHAALAPIALHLNERNRASKHAQTRCAELFLLLLLRERPMVEPALIHGVLDNGVLVFLPRFHIRGSLRLMADSAPGCPAVLPAVSTEWEEVLPATGAWGSAGVGGAGGDVKVDPPKNWVRAAAREPTDGVTLRKASDGKSLEYVYTGRDGGGGAGGEGERVPGQPPLRLLRRVWVQLSAADSRTHGPRLELTLLDASHPTVRQAVARGGATSVGAGGAEGGSLKDAMRARLKHSRRTATEDMAGSRGGGYSLDSESVGTPSLDGGRQLSGATRLEEDATRSERNGATGAAALPGESATSGARHRGGAGIFKRQRVNKRQRAAIEVFSRIFDDLADSFSSLAVEGDGAGGVGAGECASSSRKVMTSSGGVFVRGVIVWDRTGTGARAPPHWTAGMSSAPFSQSANAAAGAGAGTGTGTGAGVGKRNTAAALQRARERWWRVQASAALATMRAAATRRRGGGGFGTSSLDGDPCDVISLDIRRQLRVTQPVNGGDGGDGGDGSDGGSGPAAERHARRRRRALAAGLRAAAALRALSRAGRW